MAEDQDEKTEQATDARREEFRKRGQVAMTRELGTAALLLVAAGLIFVVGQFFFKHLAEVFNVTFGLSMVKMVRENQFGDMFYFVGGKILLLLAPVMLAAVIVGVASQVLQTGFLQVEDALTPNFNKLNPLSSLGRIFSMKGLVELLKSIVKMSVVGITMYILLKAEIKTIPYLSNMNMHELMGYLGQVLYKLLIGTGILMMIVSVADYFIQKFQLEKEMMMTKQEIKEEHKSREGDPLIKSRIRKIQREMSQRKMLQEIPKANVVITNPTHIAIVLKYDDKLPAPQLIAKGADFMAEKIKEIAKAHNIPVIENKPLARTIYKTLKIGQVIPRELFVAVAEVLSYVYRLKKRKNKNQNRMRSADQTL